jgi:predicted nuclease with TOPRIM domain
MSDVSKDDVQAIVRDAVRDIKADFSQMRDQMQRVDKRTDDLDESQHEIRELFRKIEHLYPKLDELVNLTDEITIINRSIEDIRLRTQNIERGIVAITTYLQAKQQAQDEDQRYKHAD